MTKARQRERKRRGKVTAFIDVPAGMTLNKFAVFVNGKQWPVKGISGKRIILFYAPPEGSSVEVRRYT